MFLIDKEKNRIQKIQQATFSELAFTERNHLQEGIAGSPECLGEDLLIIQKEFDGFNDTSERLDLLALDKDGTLVVIENKLDDSGKDVTWQVLKYVSYCSTLKKEQIRDIYQSYLSKAGSNSTAEEMLSGFFSEKPYEELSLNTLDQRIILVAGYFRKEVTSTVMWLLNHGIRVQCFKATPYQHGNEIFLDIEQIIPIKEAEEYIIRIAEKAQRDKEESESSQKRYALRKAFWAELLERFNAVSPMYKNVNPTDDHWLSCGSGVSGCPFQFLITKTYSGVDLNISGSDKERNKQIYDALFAQKDKIEDAFGGELIWERLDEKISSLISCKLTDVDVSNREDWERIITFLCDAMPRLEHALKDKLKAAAK